MIKVTIKKQDVITNAAQFESEEEGQREVEFKSDFLTTLRKNAKPLPLQPNKGGEVINQTEKNTFLSTYDTASLNVEIE
jgi:hypothetical protein